MTTVQAGMTALSIASPSILRTNAYWRENYSEIVARAEELTLAKLWGANKEVDRPAPSTFERTMMPYLEDPFRGAVERRIRAKGETALSMELAAARGVLDAAGLTVDDLDLALVTSFVADRFGVGNAAHFAEQMRLRAPAWNYETACSGSVVGLHQAASLIRSGDYRRILVVASTSNSVQVDDGDSLGWFVGDGAGAMIVEVVPEGFGVLAHHTLNSIGTNDMFIIRSVPTDDGGTRLHTDPNKNAANMARDTAEPYLIDCIEPALEKANLSVADVDFWVFNTPTAWYAEFCGQVLGVDPERYHSIYPRYGNIGAALMPTTLFHALREEKVHAGDLVVLYSIGSTSTASAVVMRMSEVALGPMPSRPAADGVG